MSLAVDAQEQEADKNAEEHIDALGDTLISWDDFVVFIVCVCYSGLEDLYRLIFDCYDFDGNGHLDMVSESAIRCQGLLSMLVLD